MASQGPTLTQAGADNAAVGTLAWTNPNNITLADATYATNNFGPVAGVPADLTVTLWNAGAAIGTPAAAINLWPLNTDALATYGSAVDMWGLTTATLNPTTVNGAGFGFAMSCGGKLMGVTHFLVGVKYGFTIPAGATITGVVVQMFRHYTTGLVVQVFVDYYQMTIYYTLPGGGNFFLMMGNSQ